MKLVTLTLAGVIAAGGLMATVAMAPSQPNPVLLVQDQTRAVTVTGVAIGVDGQPAAKLPATLLSFDQPTRQAGGSAGDPDFLSVQDARRDGFKVVGRQMTDESGRFTFRNVRAAELRLEIGDKMRTEWVIKMLLNDGKKETIDMGQVQLRAPLGRDEQ